MLDPLADPRATDLLAAVPDDVAMLAATFRAAAGEAELTAAGLGAAQQDAVWTGRAADRFRDSIGHVPEELDRVRAGYAAVAAALSAYEPELARVQSTFVTVVAELTAIQATGRVDAHARECAELTARAQALLDEFSTVRATCRDEVAAAQATAPVRPRARPPAGSAVVSVDGTVAVARRRIGAMIRRADALLGTPYVSGGGHSTGAMGDGLDCSGFVSAVLRSGGALSAPVTTEGFAAQPGIASGPGRLVTIYDRTGCGPNEHVIIDLAGRFYESGGGSASGGAPFVHQFTPSAAYLASFNTVLHPVGL